MYIRSFYLFHCVVYIFVLFHHLAQAAYPLSTPTLDSIIEGGLNRTFRVYLPAGYQVATAQPLIIMSHGAGGTSGSFSVSSRMTPLAEANNLILVYGDGTPPTGGIQTWNAGECCGQARRDNVDDVGFISSMIDYLGTKLCIDLNRVYAAGHSNGGMLTQRLACELSNKIAAFVPNSGPLELASSQCDSDVAGKRKPSIMHIHGTGDANVPWAGGIGCGIAGDAGINFTSVSASMEGWRARVGCATTKSFFYQDDNGICMAYDGCPNKASVILCAVYDGGHAWFGGTTGSDPCVGAGTNNSLFSSPDAAWNFMKDITLDGNGNSNNNNGNNTNSQSSGSRPLIYSSYPPLFTYVFETVASMFVG